MFNTETIYFFNVIVFRSKNLKKYIFINIIKFFFFFKVFFKNSPQLCSKKNNWIFFSNILNNYFLFFRKLSCSGKAFKFFLDERCLDNNWLDIVPNKAHVTWLCNKNSIFKLLPKNKIGFYFFKKKSLYDLNFIITHLRKVNIFTGRGFKINLNMVFKKKGKISTYTPQSN